jgi:poly-gamma-glutamate capsule biosynthesis protein CapA/YwtB (metallophosphatase superfamily)
MVGGRRCIGPIAIAVAMTVLAPCAPAGDATLTFRAGCTTGERVILAAVGDLLFHNALQRQALTRTGDYKQFWQSLTSVLRGADVTYGNLEGPVARAVALGGYAARDPGRRWDGRVYGAPRGSLVFNYHPSLIEDLTDTGFDVVSTANNHAADRGALGMDRTIDALEARGLKFSGTKRRDADAFYRWAVKTKAGDMTIAWIACTYSTNGMPDRHDQALNCYTDRARVFEEIRWNAQDPDVDAVILTPHWGIEQSPVPKRSDRAYARDAIAAGASAVIGTHPHVLQSWEKITTENGRDGLVIYSTGNFISNQVSDDQRTGIVALVELTRTSSTKAEVSAAGFIPTWVTRGRHRVNEMRINAKRGARAFSSSLNRLPTGNYVSARDFRNLPRACPVTANATEIQASDAR